MSIQAPKSGGVHASAGAQSLDPSSGVWLERVIFNHRLAVILLCLLATVALALGISRLRVNANFEKVIPHTHPYIVNYLEHKDQLRSLGNGLRIVVENPYGDIFDKRYLERLKKVNDAVYLTRGVNRPFVKSLWMAGVRWTEVTEEGFRGGPVMPDSYDGSAGSLAQLKLNVARAGLRGNLVASDSRSSMIVVPLLDRYADTGERLDYGALGKELETRIRAMEGGGDIKIHIIGYGKLMGDLIEGLAEVMSYFAYAALIVFAAILFYTRCLRSTLLVLVCSLIGVVWELGTIGLLGYELDPYSMLVPFLVFAIGVSHGAQKMNGIAQDIAHGISPYVAARFTFRRLFLTGAMALVADIVGFAVLMLIDIPIIKDLAVTASIGVTMLIVTNLVLLPVLLSYSGVSARAIRRVQQESARDEAGLFGRLSRVLVGLTRPGPALAVLAGAGVLGIASFIISLDLQIGDLDAGAPELRADSRYNRDNAYITKHYALSGDQFAVIVKTPKAGCEQYRTIVQVDRLAMALRQTPGVQGTFSLADVVPTVTAGFFEGAPKWQTISHNQGLVNTSVFRAFDNNPDLTSTDCSVLPVVAYLNDHKAATLSAVLQTVERFAAANNTPELQFLPVAGSAGIEAVTNIVVKASSRTMMLYVYAVVALLCLITFRSWRAVVVAIAPLVLTSIMCEALMVMLGIGMKVASLPVIALGVGIGVDYALYLLSIQLGHMRNGVPLAEAYRRSLQFTGKVVALVGITLAAGVVTWAFSPIKFQSDMGILLTFMFVWNMVGALVLSPALSCFLLRRVESKAPAAAKATVSPVGALVP